MSSRYAPRSFLVLNALFLGFIGILIIVASCSHAQRTDTLHASVLTVKAARTEFTDWDRAHRLALVDAAKTRQELDAALSKYETEQKKLADGFDLAFELLAVAATQTDDPSLKAALAEAGAIVDAFKKLKGDL